MWTEAELKRLARRRAWVLFPSVIVSSAVMLVVIAWIGSIRVPFLAAAKSRMGDTAGEIALLLLMSSSILFFLAGLVWADYRSRRFAVRCPRCDADLSISVTKLIATTRCWHCQTKVVEDRRPHSLDVYRRGLRISQRRWLVYWFWIWPVLGAAESLYAFLDPRATVDFQPILILPGLIGTSAAGWAFVRTRDHRYLHALIASALMLGLGATLFFWYS
ncbi:hypothetical protein [Roseiconus lacunae]|uniref:hypothetical protein n=1 Tax=Roseiconus lacunae TaxID=2605694 RepID=UPI001E2DD312|nr:hypothetical protein [Roseiconus lacunae]MCD0460258.1 hypothetical protein [Roseiconus lacunae]